MPEVVAAVASTMFAVILPTWVTATIGAALYVGATFGLGLIAKALSPKPKQPSISDLTQGRAQMVRSTVAPQQIIFGETVVSGEIIHEHIYA